MIYSVASDTFCAFGAPRPRFVAADFLELEPVDVHGPAVSVALVGGGGTQDTPM